MHAPPTILLASAAGIAAVGARAYLALLHQVGLDDVAESQALRWALFPVGASGIPGLARRSRRAPARRPAHPQQLRHAPSAACRS